MRTFSELKSRLRDVGVSVTTVWEGPGPAGSNIYYHGVVLLNGRRSVYYQDFKQTGFDYFVQTEWNDLTECEKELHMAATP